MRHRRNASAKKTNLAHRFPTVANQTLTHIVFRICPLCSLSGSLAFVCVCACKTGVVRLRADFYRNLSSVFNWANDSSKMASVLLRRELMLHARSYTRARSRARPRVSSRMAHEHNFACWCARVRGEAGALVSVQNSSRSRSTNVYSRMHGG